MTEASVLVFENDRGEKRYSPAVGSVSLHWKVGTLQYKWLSKTLVHRNAEEVLYKSKKRALAVAQRRLNRLARKTRKNFKMTGEEK